MKIQEVSNLSLCMMWIHALGHSEDLGRFKASKQSNIKSTQKAVNTHNVNWIIPSWQLCVDTLLHMFCSEDHG